MLEGCTGRQILRVLECAREPAPAALEELPAGGDGVEPCSSAPPGPLPLAASRVHIVRLSVVTDRGDDEARCPFAPGIQLSHETQQVTVEQRGKGFLDVTCRGPQVGTAFGLKPEIELSEVVQGSDGCEARTVRRREILAGKPTEPLPPQRKLEQRFGDGANVSAMIS